VLLSIATAQVVKLAHCNYWEPSEDAGKGLDTRLKEYCCYCCCQFSSRAVVGGKKLFNVAHRYDVSSSHK